MEIEFNPAGVIERYCEHHDIKPTELLAAMFSALARFRVFGSGSFPELDGDSSTRRADVSGEVDAYVQLYAPEMNKKYVLPASLYDAVALCVAYHAAMNHRLCEELADDDNPDDMEYIDGLVKGRTAHVQDILLLVMKEISNQIEAARLEMELEGML